MRGEMTAAQMVTLLGLEKSSVSRMVSRLLAAGELEERPCAEDARAKSLALTAKGHDTVAKINAWGTRQVVEALDHLDETQQQTVATGLAAYARALAQCRDSALADTAPQISLMTGYQPGMIGRIAQMHGEYYARHHDFGAFFEGKVASGVAEFATRLSSPANQIWLAIREGENRRLTGYRWRGPRPAGGAFALVHSPMTAAGEPALAGGSSARRWLSAIVASLARCSLWTFKGLDAARKLYESFGFTLIREWQGEQWGKVMTEQQFTRSGNTG
ncbi:putative MarR family regulatory protein [Klebsiella pneumoniae]|nr:putative MarR family regulatory protein [Klebsiella pneumoniae]